MRRIHYLLKYLIAALVCACLYQGISEAAVRSSSKSPPKPSDAAARLSDAATAKTSGQGYKTVGQVRYQGRPYYVVVNVQQGCASVWFRTRPDMSTRDDIKVMDLDVVNLRSLEDATRAICRAKSAYDNGKTIAGCGATIGSGICVATGGGGLSGVVVCKAVITYTTSKGLADCIDGVGGAIAGLLGREAEWNRYGAAAKLATGQLTEAIVKAIDIACADVPNK